MKGPCLNKKKNNEICTFYLEKCDLQEKDYVCDAYSTDNGFKIIDNESITQLIEENNLNSINHYDNTSIVYLYKETYIGLSKLNKNRGKIGKIFYIKKFNLSVNIVLFIYMILFLIKLIFTFICEELENGKHLFLCIFYLIFTLTCFILTLISIIKYFIISKNVLQCFDNELSNFYKHTNWQIVLEILAIKILKEEIEKKKTIWKMKI